MLVRNRCIKECLVFVQFCTNLTPAIPGGDPGMVEISEEDQKRLLAEYEEELKKCDEGKNSRRSSGTQLSSSSSGSFAFVTVSFNMSPSVIITIQIP